MKRKYNYYDSLTFLDIILNHKRKRRNKDESGDDMVEEYLEDTQTNDRKSFDQYDEDSDDSSSGSVTVKQEREEPTSTPTMEFETHMLPSADRPQEDENVKANKNFLLSLLPDVTSLNARQNMTFRLGILNLLNDIKFQQQ